MESDSPLLVVEHASSSTAAKRPSFLQKSVSSCILAEGASAAKSLEYKQTQRKLAVAIVLAFAFMIVEVVGGLYAHSLAIITDAAHLLSDVSGFAVSLFAAVYAAKRSKEHFSYGYHRVEVLGALASVLTVWLVTGILLFEAVNRVINPEPVNGKVMFILAMTGVGVNLVLVAILGGHHHHHGHDHGHDHGHGQGCGGHGHSQPHPEHGSRTASRAPLLDTVPESPGRERREAGGVHPAVMGLDPSGAKLAVNGNSLRREGQAQGEGCLGMQGDVEQAGMTHEDRHDGCSAADHHHDHGVIAHDHKAVVAAAAEGGSLSHHHDHGHSDEGGHDRRNINLRGAVVHVIGDLLQSIGVAVAGALIWYNQDDPRWYLADPICTFLFAVLVMWSTAAIVRDISDVLMERVPRGLSIASIHTALSRIPGVEEVHDLHVWSLTPGIPLLCAHINLDLEADPTDVLHAVNTYCRSLGIEHSTVQLVVNGRVCPCVEGEGGDGQH